MSMSSSDHDPGRHGDLRALLLAPAALTAVCAGLGLIAFTRPLHVPAIAKIHYTQQVSFGYRTLVRAGPVYPSGVVNTGDPIFRQLVRRIRVEIHYRLTTAATHRLVTFEAVLLRVTGPGGWSHSIPLTRPDRITGDEFRAGVMLDLPRLQAMIAYVAQLTGILAGTGYTIAVIPQVRIAGTVAGRPLRSGFAPALNFQLTPLQLMPGTGSTTAGTPTGGLKPRRTGAVATTTTTPGTLTVAGDALSVEALRWLAVAGILLAAAGTVFLVALINVRRPNGEAARIRTQYGHLIVPIKAAGDELWTPFEVT